MVPATHSSLSPNFSHQPVMNGRCLVQGSGVSLSSPFFHCLLTHHFQSMKWLFFLPETLPNGKQLAAQKRQN